MQAEGLPNYVNIVLCGFRRQRHASSVPIRLCVWPVVQFDCRYICLAWVGIMNPPPRRLKMSAWSTPGNCFSLETCVLSVRIQNRTFVLGINDSSLRAIATPKSQSLSSIPPALPLHAVAPRASHKKPSPLPSPRHQPPQVQKPFFPFPASSTPSPTLLAPLSTPLPRASSASPTGLPALPVTPVTVCPTPLPAAPTTPPAVLATPETPLPKVEVTKPIGLLESVLLFERGIFLLLLCGGFVAVFGW